MDARGIAGITLHLLADPVHHGDGFFGPGAAGGFRRKHDRIGPVVDGVGNVGHFGAGRRGGFDHRFEHLRRHDHGLARTPRHFDDMLLQRRYFFRVQFDAEIAARDHDAVRKLDNLVQPINRGGLFDLGDKRAIATHQAAGFGHVFGALDEGKRDPVRPVFDRECQIAAVLFGERRDGHNRIGHVHALAVGNNPADFGRTQDLVLAGADHLELKLAVIDQQTLALFQHLENFGMRQADAGFVARRRIAV